MVPDYQLWSKDLQTSDRHPALQDSNRCWMKGKPVEEVVKWLVNKIWVSDSLASEISRLQTAGKDHCIHTQFLQLHISPKDGAWINRELRPESSRFYSRA